MYHLIGTKTRNFLSKGACLFILSAAVLPAWGQNDSVPARKRRLTLGGYGEAVYSRHFNSDNMFRDSHADAYRNSGGHGRVDLPHVVIMLGYDFGKGWSMGSEIEFERGGVESAIEIEAEIMYNRIPFSTLLYRVNLTLGLLLFGYLCKCMLRRKKMAGGAVRLFTVFLWGSFLFPTFALHSDSLPRLGKPLFFHLYLTVSFLTIPMTYFGVNYFLGGMHSYA